MVAAAQYLNSRCSFQLALPIASARRIKTWRCSNLSQAREAFGGGTDSKNHKGQAIWKPNAAPGACGTDPPLKSAPSSCLPPVPWCRLFHLCLRCGVPAASLVHISSDMEGQG